MTGPLLCGALALLAVPASAGRRRFDELFGRRPERGGFSTATLLRCGLGIGCVVAFAFGSGVLVAAIFVLGTVAMRTRRMRRDRRHRSECGHLLDALETVIGELRVGAHPSGAAQAAAEEAAGIAAQVFAVGAARGRLGGSGADGLRYPGSVIAAELDRIADAWQVAERYGLALAELLTAARTDLAGRVRFRNRTEAALAGARATAAVLAGLPVLGIVLGQLMGAEPLRVLFASAAGTYLLPLGTALACTGLLWADAITRKVLL